MSFGLRWRTPPQARLGAFEDHNAVAVSADVRVNAVSPGYVRTPMQHAEYSDAMLDAVNRKIALGRHARPEEIAHAVLFLASDDSSFVTGEALVVDGGGIAG